MFTHKSQIRVRYAETDQMGYVYYGNYAMYYEVARVEAFRFLGFPYKDLEEREGILMPVLEMQTRYIKPALYDDLLSVHLSIREFPEVRIAFEYEIFNQKQEKVNTGKTTLVFIEKQRNKILRCPEKLKSLLEPYFG